MYPALSPEARAIYVKLVSFVEEVRTEALHPGCL
jgi:hypothetical protein